MTNPSAPSVFATGSATEDRSATVFEDGDVALVLKKDGSIRAMSFGNIDPERLKVPESELTADEHALLVQGQKLMALTFVANTPMVMNMVLEMISDPNIIDQDKLAGLAKLN